LLGNDCNISIALRVSVELMLVLKLFVGENQISNEPLKNPETLLYKLFIRWFN
jgi:hypothetical protein